MKPRHQKFCDEYLKDLNARQAAIRSGYSPKSAAAIGCRLLEKESVITYLAEKKQQLQEQAALGNQHIIAVIKDVLDYALQPVPVTRYNPKTQAHEPVLVMTEEGKYTPLHTIDRIGALRAAELLARHTGFFVPPKAPAKKMQPTQPAVQAEEEFELLDLRTIYPGYDPFSNVVNKEVVIERYRSKGIDPQSLCFTKVYRSSKDFNFEQVRAARLAREAEAAKAHA